MQMHNLEEAAGTVVDFLMGGGIVVMPMDTSYGIAADATNAEAIQQVFDIKARERTEPLSVIVEGLEQAKALGTFNQPAESLWVSFMPGPLTLVVPLRDDATLVDSVTAGHSSIGLRQPKNSLTQLVAERLQAPYTATSANRSGDPPAFSPDEFLDTLPDGVVPHLLVDAGDLPISRSSTVVSVVDGVEILREGVIAESDIRAATS